MSNYVIVGNGVAATGCIEGIREHDTEGRITVISGENRPAYCRPLISYLLEGKAQLDHMPYRDEGFYDRMGVDVRYGVQATDLDAQTRTIALDNGEIVPYDSLCIATGSSPFVPRFEGLDTVGQTYSFMTLDDALALEEALFPEARVLIVGAGLIGLKCAEGISGRVGSITVCDLADRVLSSILDTDCAALMQRRLEENGITFMLSDSAARFEGKRAIMQSGAEVDFDILVLAVGVRANTGLLREVDGALGRGIIVDTGMRTVVPNVYAAGDCAEGEDISIGARRVLAILPNAYMQGHTAGANMAGGSEAHDKAIPMNSIGFFGLHAMTAGAYTGEMTEERGENSIKRLFVEDNKLKGFILIGCDERAGIYTSLIREQTPLDSIDFGALSAGATTLAFPPEQRKIKFGSVV